jgi:1-acyl-sn-glycerol-3-phosphate acyltransferase
LKNLRLIYRWLAALTTIFITGSIGLALVLISFGTLRNSLSQYYFNYISLFILKIMGFSASIPDKKHFPKGAVYYTFNHNSNLDVFLLTSLGLKNVRYLLSEKTLKYFPLIFSAKALGSFYIPQQHHLKRRLKFLIRITNLLKRNKHLSMFGSAEGVHLHRYAIAPFNKGIFHMAMDAKLNIVPLYIHIPKESLTDDFKNAKGGTLKLEIMDEINTANWSLPHLEQHISEVRAIYVNRFNALNPNDKTK